MKGGSGFLWSKRRKDVQPLPSLHKQRVFLKGILMLVSVFDIRKRSGCVISKGGEKEPEANNLRDRASILRA